MAAFVARSIASGQRVLATIPAAAAATAVAWAANLQRAGRVEEFALGPATLEDTYVELVGRADALSNGNGAAAPAIHATAKTTKEAARAGAA